MKGKCKGLSQKASTNMEESIPRYLEKVEGNKAGSGKVAGKNKGS